MTERILKGPFLTRQAAAQRAGVPPTLLPDRPDLLRLGGQWLQETYFAFQFDRHGVRPDLGFVVQELKRYYSDVAIADWLARPHAHLNDACPLDALAWGSPRWILEAARLSGPVDEGDPSPAETPDRYLQPVRETEPVDALRPVRPGRGGPRRRIAFPHPA